MGGVGSGRGTPAQKQPIKGEYSIACESTARTVHAWGELYGVCAQEWNLLNFGVIN